jgi:nitrate reductase alpha subunit
MDVPVFNSRAQAFDFMLSQLAAQGVDLMEAAQKAEAFAEIVSKNRALPDKPQGMVQKALGTIKEVSEIKRDYPEMWDIVTGLLGGVVGVFAGTKAAENSAEDEVHPLDFDNMKDA